MRITVKQLKQLIREAVEEVMSAEQPSGMSADEFFDKFRKAHSTARVERFGSNKSPELVAMLEDPQNEEVLHDIYEFLKTNKSKRSEDLAKYALFSNQAKAAATFEEFKNALVKKYTPTDDLGLSPEEKKSAHIQAIKKTLGL